MEFSAYSEYKHSGVEWLGEVPKHWDVVRFGKIFDENKRKNLGMKETNVLSLSYGNIKEKNIDDNKGLLPESFETYQIIEPNDIIFRFTDLQNDKRSLRNAISKFHGIITSAYISVKTQQNSDFYNYLFRAYDLKKVFYSMGDGMRQSLKMDELNRMPVVLPSINEQNQIAQFLDKETAKIDELIAKQEQLIVLLEEQRKSVISHAVTKGLNPNTPMKDSGVEWLGEVPEHWQVLQLKQVAIGFTNGTTAEQMSENFSVYKVSRIESISQGVIDYEKVGYLPNNYNLEKFKLNKNDFLISHINSFDKVGNSAMYDGREVLYHGMNLIRFTPISINPIFMGYFIKTENFLYQLKRVCKPAVNQVSLTSFYIKSARITFPPVNEQNQIAQFLDKETAKIDELIQKQQKLITQLKEYRSSVISYAVTGKIDVRGLV
ncbi:restriction endonuclease subunit S [Moraxella sp. RCAD0137]|uniref:restriction endonuclease subunit S n=1 Tax=Moraxella sp. RCAD0137 TaxID=1775913 RepID=UPI000C9FBE0B|nr:restriction endonuclease subunit S [Moraxella sp. RCAD0137]PNP96962.1 type I restriction endonuclease subunit S [Moraxella sp. RCAD0137]